MYVLIVDDSRAMRMMIGRVVRALGYQIMEAGDGREALDTLQGAETPALILVDWNMPNMNGLELVQALRAQPRFQQTDIVMVTTEIESANMNLAIEAGADEYVMKPFTPQLLADKIRELRELKGLV